MPKITFTVDHTPPGHAPNRPTYKAGETYDLEASYAEKYVRRGWAVPAVPPPAEEPKAPPAVEEKVERRRSRMFSRESSLVGERGPEILNPGGDSGVTGGDGSKG